MEIKTGNKVEYIYKLYTYVITWLFIILSYIVYKVLNGSDIKSVEVILIALFGMINLLLGYMWGASSSGVKKDATIQTLAGNQSPQPAAVTIDNVETINTGAETDINEKQNKHKKDKDMSTKNVAFFNESASDQLLSFTIDGTTDTYVINRVVSGLPGSPAGLGSAFKQLDDNNVLDACAVIDSSDTATASFKRSDNSTYTKSSNDFIGGKPPVRPGS